MHTQFETLVHACTRLPGSHCGFRHIPSSIENEKQSGNKVLYIGSGQWPCNHKTTMTVRSCASVNEL